MNDANGLLFGSFGVVVIIFLIVLGILWFLLPFAVFGTKPKLDEQTALLKALTSAVREQSEILRRIEGLARGAEVSSDNDRAKSATSRTDQERKEPKLNI